MAQLAAQVGAAALAIGLSLAGPQAAGLAAAESGDASASSAGSDSNTQSGRTGNSTGSRGPRAAGSSRRGAAPRPVAAARQGSANTSAAVPAAGPHPIAAAADGRVQPVTGQSAAVQLSPAPWLRVGGASPSAATTPATAASSAIPAAPAAVVAPSVAVASVGVQAVARSVSSAWSRLMSDLMPAQGLAEGALLLFRRGAGAPTVRTAVPRAAAAVDSNGNQTITLDGSKSLEDAMSIRGVLFGLFGGTLNSLDDLVSGGYVHNYVAVNFTATETKTYVFGQTSATQDTVIVVYDGAFNPANPRTNAAVLNDNATSPLPTGIVSTPGGCGGNSSDCPQVSVNLTAGQTVTLVVTTAGADTLANPRPFGLSDSVALYTNGAGYFWHPNDNFPSGNVTVNLPDAGGQVSGTANVTDPDGDPLTYTATTPGKGSVTVNPDGTFVYTATAGARHAAAADGAAGNTLADSFDITAADGRGGFVTIPVVLAVAPANAAPTGNASVGSTDAATGAVTGTAGVTDGDSDPLTYTASAPANGSVTLGPNGAFTYTPTDAARHAAASGGATGDSFTITVTDGHGGTLTIPVMVGITASNAAPTGNASLGSTDATTGAVTGAVDVTDGDSDPLTYTASTPANGSVTLGPNGAFTYTPTDAARHAAAADGAPASALADTFTITVSDGHGGTADVPVVVTIAAANAIPVASANVDSGDSAGVVVGTVAGADGDSDVLSYKASTPAMGVVTLGPDGSFTYTPSDTARHAAAADGAPASALADTFTITVSDGHGGTIDVPVSVDVLPANAVPTGTLRLDTQGSGGSMSGAVEATDADSDPLTYTASAPANGSVTVSADGSFMYMPTPHKATAGDSFTITVSDGHGGTVDVPVTVPAPAAAAVESAGTGGGGGGGQIGAGYSGPAAVSVAAAVDVTEAVSVAAVADVAADVAAAEAAPAAAAAETEQAAAPAELGAEAAASTVSAAASEAAGQDGSSKDGSDADGHGSDARGAFASRPGGPQRPAMSSGKSAGRSAGRSAGKPFTPSTEEAEKAGPYSPANPAAALGLVGMLLMAIPMAGVSASAAAASTKTTA